MCDAQQFKTVWLSPYISVQDTVAGLTAKGYWPPGRVDLCCGSPLMPGGRCDDCRRFHEGRNA